MAYFFVVGEPNLLFSRGQLLEYQGIKIGSHDRIRTCTTNTLNVPPTAIWATWPFFGASGEIRTLMPFGTTTSRLCVYHSSTTDAGRQGRTRTYVVSNVRDLQSRAFATQLHLTIKEDALAVDCSALM